MERSVLRSAVGRMREAELTGGFSRSRAGLFAAAGVFSYLLDLFDVQYLRISLCEHARLRRHDLRRRDGTLPKIESRVFRRQLLVGAMAALAHGRIRGNYRQSGISLSQIDAARILSAPVLRRGGMRRDHGKAYSRIWPRRQHGLFN